MMLRDQLDRRDFGRMAMAAFGGLVAGTTLGCGGGTTGADKNDEDKGDDKDKSPLLSEPHVCCGLNTCKGNGKGGKNECAGQGTCASVKSHSCKGENECKGHGGCGENPGENACKGEGACAVPLKPKVWKKAREHFEAAMKKAGKKFGDAPEDCGKEKK